MQSNSAWSGAPGYGASGAPNTSGFPGASTPGVPGASGMSGASGAFGAPGYGVPPVPPVPSKPPKPPKPPRKARSLKNAEQAGALLPSGAMQLPDLTDAMPRERIRRRRKIALAVATPIALVFFAAGVALLTLHFWALSSRGEYADNNVPGAVSGYSDQTNLAQFTPLNWLAEYNLGTALLASERLEEGIAHLEVALEGVPTAIRDEDGRIETYSYECAVRSNLAVAYELNGDSEAAAETLEPCSLDDSSGDSSQSGEDSSSGGGSGTEETESSGSGQDNSEETPDTDPYANETEEQRERREQLEEKNQQQDEREREQEESENWYYNGGNQGW